MSTRRTLRITVMIVKLLPSILWVGRRALVLSILTSPLAPFAALYYLFLPQRAAEKGTTLMAKVKMFHSGAPLPWYSLGVRMTYWILVPILDYVQKTGTPPEAFLDMLGEAFGQIGIMTVFKSTVRGGFDLGYQSAKKQHEAAMAAETELARTLKTHLASGEYKTVKLDE